MTPTPDTRRNLHAGEPRHALDGPPTASTAGPDEQPVGNPDELKRPRVISRVPGTIHLAAPVRPVPEPDSPRTRRRR